MKDKSKDTWWYHNDQIIYDELGRHSYINPYNDPRISIICEALRRIMEKLKMIKPEIKKRYNDEELEAASRGSET